MSENTKSKNKRTPILGIAGVAGIILLIAVIGVVGEKTEDRIADAQSSNQELQDQITVLQSQMNATIVVLTAHENVLQQHDLQIRGIANSTNVIGSWAEQFSTNVDNRLIALEGE